ncbi:hypothetical protein L1987_35907 [Smallanthus sonchifolius]|uniref:Uncharacterized protein n=1 Tax=Smallanthus sonchifolius TaxID=185202 RepID=A0ACB9HD78_9ASTR|nr:hypothetical protein L1987_35907 [Smallanthus sonchifolius]
MKSTSIFSFSFLLQSILDSRFWLIVTVVLRRANNTEIKLTKVKVSLPYMVGCLDLCSETNSLIVSLIFMRFDDNYFIC